MSPRVFTWRFIAGLVGLLAVMHVLLRFAPNPCEPGLELSPYSGVCSAEGSDHWFGAP